MANSIDFNSTTVEIFNDVSGIPHTFIVVTDENGIQTQYDFYPKIEGTGQGARERSGYSP